MRLVDRYDAALFDLDGVIYLGPRAIGGVPEALHTLRTAGTRVGFVTNNAARSPAAVAEHLGQLGIKAAPGDVVNSTMALVRMLREQLASDATLLCVGTCAMEEQLRDAGFTIVASRKDRPTAVVQGYDPEIKWAKIEEGAFAIQDGAKWFLSNPDLSRPTERGIVPGCGAQAYAVAVCVQTKPQIAGKPYPPLLVETVERLNATRPIFVGDRTDTDLRGANSVGMDSLFVFTGVHGKRDLKTADEASRPTWIGGSVAALLQPPRTAESSPGSACCNSQRVLVADRRASLLTTASTNEEQLDALWALLQLHWQHRVEIDEELDKLELLR